jgi:ATP-binding cassette subfamily F protein 1
VYDEQNIQGVHRAERKARKILAGLGFTLEMMERPTRHFSGGWRMRISLARALFVEPTLLLLDEPTNHLDLNAVLWLDEYLQNWKNTLMVVSHDQDFLHSVVTDIISIEDRKLVYYRGDYDSYKSQQGMNFEKRIKEYKQQQKTIKALKSKGITRKAAEETAKTRVRAGGKKGRGGAAAETSEEVTASLQLLDKPKEYTVNFNFPNPSELAPPVLDIREVSFKYGEKYPWLFEDVTFGIDQSSRIAIVGPNGVGKSTLLNLIMGDLEATQGEITRNRFLRIGKYNQHFVDVLPMGETPVQFLQRKHDVRYQEARAILGRFGLEAHAHEIKMTDLSGGQKARVVFASLSKQDSHILFMDEPTNHLDIESIDALADAIAAFNGGVVLVSHDARLIQATDCRLWVIEGDRKVTQWEADFEDYRDSLLKDQFEEEQKLDSLAERMAKEAEEAQMAKSKERAERIAALRIKQGKPAAPVVADKGAAAVAKLAGGKGGAAKAAKAPTAVVST